MWTIHFFTLFCSAILLIYLFKRGGYVEFPFLAAMMLLGWFVPQLYIFASNRTYDSFLIDPLVIFAALSVGALLLGWQFGRSWGLKAANNAETERSFDFRTDISSDTITLWPLALLTVFVIIIQVLVLNIQQSTLERGGPTGVITILAFLADLRSIGLAFSLILFLSRPSMPVLVLLLGNLACFFPSIVLQVKRNDIVEVCFVVIASYWLVKRKLVPRLLIAAGSAGILVLVSSISQLRRITGFETTQFGERQVAMPSFSDIAEIDFMQGLKDTFTSASLEVQNAAYFMNYINENSMWSYGGQFWNRLVKLYVPGQFVGQDTKDSLYQGLFLYGEEFSRTFYQRSEGSTITGFTQAFADFSYAGCLVFLVTGFFIGRAFGSALTGSLTAAVFYIGTTVVALHALTHDSYWYLAFAPFYLAIAWLLIRFSRRDTYMRTVVQAPAAI
ncbi:hypothetical protein [Aurantiacibacter sediminis]|uniref:Oligosaccharide repeat unit polymerase n=1 Tax=Aurantiacibacter sediminis TaxID=2793064 RepID=A0ABS0N3B3_9SPHN|nr:hypothetical protein [Aurantiacibacter sediminis]MBH5322442.1 hypothetical protein [Aurantiacibacter sediminis]